jgi:DNA-directed RNA polymerase specialized sigma24 family protein
MEQAPDTMPLSALTYRCSQELGNYRQQKASDDRYCLEIFRRAMVDGDNEAWVALQERFRDNVLYWLRCHAKRQEALQIDTAQSYVDDTFKRLWQWSDNQKLEFRSLAGALKFLHDCLLSSITDNLRRYAWKERVPLPEYAHPNTWMVEEESYDRNELWKSVQAFLTDKHELRVIFLLYYEGLKPKEIVKRCPEEFADEKEVYRLTRRALYRLRQHADILRWKISYGE